jgi:hypothetical protein
MEAVTLLAPHDWGSWMTKRCRALRNVYLLPLAGVLQSAQRSRVWPGTSLGERWNRQRRPRMPRQLDGYEIRGPTGFVDDLDDVEMIPTTRMVMAVSGFFATPPYRMDS